MRKFWDWEFDVAANVWRFKSISGIQNNGVRRALIVATFPFMFGWFLCGIAWGTLKYLTFVASFVALIPVYPVFQFFRAFPVELFRSALRRWKEPAP